VNLPRRAFLGGACAFCSSALFACTPTSPDGPQPQTGIGGRSDLAPRNTPGMRTRATDDDEDGIRGMLDQMERRMQTSRFLIRDQAINGYIRRIVREIAGEYADDIRPYVVRVPDFNATQAPNGMMQIWTGLLLRCTNEAQLVAVLGHEVGHYIRAHSRESVRTRRQIVDAQQVLAMIFGAAGLPQVSDLTGLILTASIFSYGRDHEREADEIGIRILADRGLAPVEAARNWENVTAEAAALGIPRDRSTLFSTHPSDSERTESLRRRAAELPAGDSRASSYWQGIDAIRPMLFEDEIRTARHPGMIVIADRWLAARPGDGYALYARGESLRQRNGKDDEAQAIESLSAATTAEDGPAAAWRSLGLLRRRRGETGESRDLLLEYLRRAPNAPDRDFIRNTIRS
jgi:beta-barrel assembly-enhancing protease